MAMVGGGGKSSKRGYRKISSEINITPIVDVMLVLLVIFMVTAPMLISGIKVDLPETTAKPIAGQEEPLAISIDKNGKIYLMDTLIEENMLIEKLKAITKAKMDTRIFVRADQNLTYGAIMSIVGEINAAGFSRVALITNVKQGVKQDDKSK
jgi:biopolymer transport protein TolR